MSGQEPGATTGKAGFLELAISQLWKSKWLIGAATIVAAAVAFAVAQAGSVEIWSGRTTLTIGLAPSITYLFFGGTPPVELIESQRAVVSRISDQRFKAGLLNGAAFDQATAARSRALVDSSLRGIVLDGDRDIAVELSAASPADVKAAFQALDAEISKVHGDMLARRLQLLQQRIDQDGRRMTDIEKSSDQLLDRFFKDSDGSDTPRLGIFEAIPAWNDLKDRVQNDTNLKQLTEPSVVHLEPGSFLQGPRDVAAMKTSLLAGSAMLVASVILTFIVNLRARPSAR
jgi:hypothetical protein